MLFLLLADPPPRPPCPPETDLAIFLGISEQTNIFNINSVSATINLGTQKTGGKHQVFILLDCMVVNILFKMLVSL